jgi:5-formyltetrahydrofolate cyclo-ligase
LINKSNIRKHFLTQRNLLSAHEVEQLSRDIYRQILSTSVVEEAKFIASYFAISNEASVNLLLTEHNSIYLPVIKANHSMEFSKYTCFQELIKNKYGIPEPVSKQIISAHEIGVCFVPLVAFNRQGVRLGMGGGYYDRYFEHNKDNKKPTKLVGIAYDFQESDTIKAQSWDIPLDTIITNKEVITP